MPDPGQLDRAREQVHEAHDLLDDMGVARQEVSDLSLSPPRWLTLKERIERLPAFYDAKAHGKEPSDAH